MAMTTRIQVQEISGLKPQVTLSKEAMNRRKVTVTVHSYSYCVTERSSAVHFL
jgi:hypothetical protein